MTNNPERKIMRRRLTGIVLKDKMQKTVVVGVTRFKKHPKYLKYYKVSSRFKAHDEAGEYKAGDKVLIEETRPLSKDKRWKVISKIGESPKTKLDLTPKEDSVEEPSEN